MEEGQVILNRLCEPMFREVARELGATYEAYSSDWVWRFDRDNTTARIVGYKCGLNNAASSAVASDKVAAAEIMRAADVDAVQHVLVRKDAKGKLRWYGELEFPVVVKPLQGTSGSGVKKCETRHEAERWMMRRPDIAWAVSPFVNIVREIRSIVLDGEILLAYEKQPVTIDGLKMFNLGLGATPREVTIDAGLRDLVTRAMHTIGLRVAAVDCIETSDGTRYILEVNDGIMMENYMRQGDVRKQKGYGIYRAIIERMLTD